MCRGETGYLHVFLTLLSGIRYFPGLQSLIMLLSTKKHGYVWMGGNKLPLLLKRSKIADELPVMEWFPSHGLSQQFSPSIPPYFLPASGVVAVQQVSHSYYWRQQRGTAKNVSLSYFGISSWAVSWLLPISMRTPVIPFHWTYLTSCMPFFTFLEFIISFFMVIFLKDFKFNYRGHLHKINKRYYTKRSIIPTIVEFLRMETSSRDPHSPG